MRTVRALLALLLSAGSAPAQTAEPAAIASRLSITVVTSEAGVPTLRERVSSWFRDGTEVSVGVAVALPTEQLFSVGPDEVEVWLVQLSPERALIVFASAGGTAGGRYLVREVRLVSGLDELGLERVASVIHTASVALREGIEGLERPEVERELVEAGLLPSAANPGPEAPAPAAPVPARVTTAPAPPARATPAATATAPGLLLAAGYGTRARGVERLGHGPLVSAGLQLPGAGPRFDFLLSAHLLFRSDFDAGAFAASLQTSAFRAQLGLEPALTERLTLQALVGAGADLAQVSASAERGPSGQALSARAPGGQWRGALELSLGLWWQGSLFDLGALAHTSFLFGDVHYSLVTADGEQRLVTPWPVQPGLSLQVRIRSAR